MHVIHCIDGGSNLLWPVVHYFFWAGNLSALAVAGDCVLLPTEGHHSKKDPTVIVRDVILKHDIGEIGCFFRRRRTFFQRESACSMFRPNMHCHDDSQTCPIFNSLVLILRNVLTFHNWSISRISLLNRISMTRLFVSMYWSISSRIGRRFASSIAC